MRSSLSTNVGSWSAVVLSLIFIVGMEKSSSKERRVISYMDHLFSLFPNIWRINSSHPEVFLGKAVLKICSKCTGEHPRRSVISIKLPSSFIEITLRHGCSPVNLLHVFRKPFVKNTSGRLLLKNNDKDDDQYLCWSHPSY